MKKRAINRTSDNWPDKSKRSELAKNIHGLREDLYTEAYDMSRGFDVIQEQTNLDVKKYLDERLQEGARTLDVGAGNLQFAEDMKDRYGGKVKVEAITPYGLNIGKSRESWVKYAKGVKRKTKEANKNRDNPHNKSRIRIASNKKIRETSKAYERSKKIDKKHTGIIETFDSEEKYDLITDWFAATMYSQFQERVFDRYFNLLNPDGIAIIASRNVGGIIERINSNYGPKSENAKKEGAYLEANAIDGSKDVLEIRKKSINELSRESLETKLLTSAVISCFIVSIFLLSENITGNAVLNLTQFSSNVSGVIIFLIGLIFLFYCIKKQKNNQKTLKPLFVSLNYGKQEKTF